MKDESLRRGFAFTVIVSSGSRAVGFLQGILTAAFFGVTPAVDVYFYVSNTIFLAASLLRGINSAVVIPRFFEIEQKSSRKKAIAFFNYFYLWVLGLGLLAALLLVSCPDQIWAAISSFEPVLIRQHRGLLEWAALLIFGLVNVYYLTDLLSACRVFTRPLLSNLLANTSPILFLLVDRGRHGAAVLLAGAATGSLLNTIILGYWAWTMAGWRPWLASRPEGRSVWRDIGYVQLGNIVSTGGSYAVLYLFSGLGQGVVSAFNYARTLANIPQVLLVDHISSFIGLKFNEALAVFDWRTVNRVFRRTLLLAAFLLWPACFLIWTLRIEFVQLFFYFHPQSAATMHLVAGLVAILTLTIPLLVINTLVARAFMAAKIINKSFYIQLVLNSLLLAAFWSVKDRFGAMGYVYLQLLLFSVLIIGVLPRFIRNWLPEFSYAKALPGFFSFGLCCGLVALGVSLTARWGHWGPVALTAGACGGLALTAAVFFLLTPQRAEIAQEIQALWPFKRRLRGAR